VAKSLLDSSKSWSKYSSLFSEIAILNKSFKYSRFSLIISKSFILPSIFFIFLNINLPLSSFHISGFSLSDFNFFNSLLSEEKSNPPPQ